MKCPNCGEEMKETQSIPEVWECGNCGRLIDPLVDLIHAEEFSSNKKQINKRLVIGVGAALVVTALVTTFVIRGMRRDFSTLYRDIQYKKWCEIAEDGSYMKIDTNPYDSEDCIDFDAYYKLEEINRDLGFSAVVYEKMGETTALDGRQTEKGKRATASWKYHPDTGLEVTYEWN